MFYLMHLRPMAMQLNKLGSSVLGISLGYWKNFSFDMRKRSLVAFDCCFVFCFFFYWPLISLDDSKQVKRKFEILHSVWFVRCVKIFFFFLECVYRSILSESWYRICICVIPHEKFWWPEHVLPKIEYIYILAGTT